MTESKHTPEPWTIGGDGGDIFGPGTPPSFGDSHHVADCQTTEPGLLGLLTVDVANAARIVACVNACKGINPEAIPDMMAALAEAESKMMEMDLRIEGEWGDPAVRDEMKNKNTGWCDEIYMVRAALAKAKDGQS